MREAGCLRASSLEQMHEVIEYRNHNRRIYSGIREQISPDNVINLRDMWHRLQSVRDQIKLVVSFDCVYVYSNDPGLLTQLASAEYTDSRYGQQALVTLPRDVVCIKNPKFKYRSYFRDKTLTQEQFDQLKSFLASRKDCYGITKSLQGNLKYARWPFLQRHWFVEHNDPKDITMLSLVCPGVIRKTLPVQAK